jgi:hypothetical protein
MRSAKIKFWTDGNNAVRVDHLVTDIIMPADMIEVHGVGDTGLLNRSRTKPRDSDNRPTGADYI